ncbi:MAG: glycosyltransferase [Chlorobiaceae bacterium]
MIKNQVDCVVRFHDPSRINELKRCVFSLVGQKHRPLHIILVVQRFNDEQITNTREALRLMLSLSNAPALTIINFESASPLDARTALLNMGLEASSGQYIGFLDYDDVLYPEAYSFLTHRLNSTGKAIAFGTVRVVYANVFNEFIHVSGQKKGNCEDKYLKDLFRFKCCPINSFLIDRFIVSKNILSFDNNLTLYEYYDLLSKICATYSADFAGLKMIIGEYYYKNDGSNLIPVDGRLSDKYIYELRKVFRFIENRTIIASFDPALQKKPRILWANLHCLLDISSEASISCLEMLKQLAGMGYEVAIVGATIFDNPTGILRLREYWVDVQKKIGQLITLHDGFLKHSLVVTKSTYRYEMTSKEETIWHKLYTEVLDSFKPDMVFFFGDQAMDFLVAAGAKHRGIPVVAYLATSKYTGNRWCRDVDVIITDSHATADRYFEEESYKLIPVGKFIDTALVVAAENTRERLLFINPSLEKGAGLVILLAYLLEKRRPDIQFEVIDSSGKWHELVKAVTYLLGDKRELLSNVIVTSDTVDRRTAYGKTRVLLAPGFCWETSDGWLLAEAMLNGIPAVINGHGEAFEMVQKGGVVLKLQPECYVKPFTKLPKIETLEPFVDFLIRVYEDQPYYNNLVSKAYYVGRTMHNISTSTNRLIKAIEPVIKKKWSAYNGGGETNSLPPGPVIICPYLKSEDNKRVREAFGLDEPRGKRLPFFFWHDVTMIGAEAAFQHCWSQFQNQDVIIIHPDMSPMPEDRENLWYEKLLAYVDRLPDAGAIACDLLFSHKTKNNYYATQCAGGIFTDGGKIKHQGGEEHDYDERYKSVRIAEWVTFGGVYLRRQALDMCKDFDTRYQWSYVMDVDYCMEMRLRGWHLYQVPVNLIHEEQGSTRPFLEKPEYQAKVKHNYDLFYQKWSAILPSLP